MRTSALALISTLGLVSAGLAVPAAADAATCTSTAMTIVAHEDDDLLFINPDIQDALAGGACMTTVFVTAGDAGESNTYWQNRENGPVAAYSGMLALPADATWTTSTRAFAGQTVTTRTSPGGQVTLAYMRLPDGGIGGGGTASRGGASLKKLWDGALASISALDGSASYTRAGLIQSLAAMVSAYQPNVVRIQDARTGQGDHSDHLVTGQFSMEALYGYTGSVTAYRGYGVTAEPANISGDKLAKKNDTLLKYAAYDALLCSTLTECPTGTAAQWAQRQYTAPLPTSLTPIPGPAPYAGPNVARNARVLASSASSGQPATAAIDSVIGGYPGNGGAEWSSAGQRTNAWLHLTWGSAQTIDRVRLFDRPNGSDQVTGGTLTFSDGTTVTVPALNNDGSATVVTFPARATTSLRFTITAVSASTGNVGLSEIEASNGDPAPPAATPVPGPAPYAGPNVARNAGVLASSAASGQPATAAIDSVIGGYPGNAGAEWSSAGQRGGAWLQLSWGSAQTIDRVRLFDRPNGSDQVTGGTLTFSDGTTVTVPALNNDGSATVVTFPARATTSLRFTITAVSAATGNVGLSEIEAYNGDPTPPPTSVPGPAPYSGPNVARNSSVLASSAASGQPATAAIDSVRSGFPANAAAEWSSAGQRTGAWLQLSWTSAQTLDRVYLYDRPNGSDQVTGGTLTFSDGTTVAVPTLNNDGTATVVTFPARPTTSLRFTVSAVSGATGNVGLSEIEAYNGDPTPAPTPPPAPTPVPGPAAYNGPNMARNAGVLASSAASGQPATAAIDNVRSGFPANAGAEWSSAGQRTGAWLQLSWTSAQTLDRVYLYDRPNGSDQVTGGTLTFSDGTTVAVPALNNDGTATVVTFPGRSTASLRFTVTAVSGATGNVGLSELEAYNGDPTPAPTPVPGPAAYDGPNVARNAGVLASSAASGQPATAAIDSVIAGFPANAGAEWSSAGQRAGAWLQLSWGSPQTIDRVRVYDRPNGSDQVTGGTLTFSDGTTVTVPALNNDGTATLVTFPARATTSLRFTVTAVSGATGNVGLAELEAYNGDPG